MTKKDYEVIANGLHESKSKLDFQFGTVLDVLCNVLAKENPKFNAIKFKEACLSGKYIRNAIKTK